MKKQFFLSSIFCLSLHFLSHAMDQGEIKIIEDAHENCTTSDDEFFSELTPHLTAACTFIKFLETANIGFDEKIDQAFNAGFKWLGSFFKKK